MCIIALFQQAAADRRHGANEIERRLIRELLNSKSEWRRELIEQGAQKLVSGQPSMANIRRLAIEMLETYDLGLLEKQLAVRGRVLADLPARLAEHGAEMVMNSDRVVTLSRSTAVYSVVTGAATRGWRGRVVVLDGTPSGRGIDQAADFCASGINAQSLPDGAVFEAFDEPASRLLIVVGADAVSCDRFVNAQGTHVLLEIGSALGVRRALIADSGKQLRDADLDGILAASPMREESGPGRRWPVFEAIPLDLVNLRVTESGRFPAC